MNKCLIVVPLWPTLLVLKLQISLIDYTLSFYSNLTSSQQVTLHNIDLINLGMTWSLLCAKCTTKTQATLQSMMYMNHYQCARTQCYEHNFYWLASWLRLQQQSHSKMIIPDFWRCQNFTAGYLWLKHCDSGHHWISQSQSNVVQPFCSQVQRHRHVSLTMLIFCLGQSKIAHLSCFPEWCSVWFWRPITHSGWVQMDNTSFGSLCVSAYFRMLLGNIRCFICPSVSCIKFQAVFSFNLVC